MKKFGFILMMLLLTAGNAVNGQNVQFLYDLGHTFYGDLSSRPNVTTTVEMFKKDKWGSNFFFIDLTYFTDGIAGAYWEFSREFSIAKNNRWAAHIEYNGGATSIEHTAIASRFQHALLLGGAWNWASADYTKTFSLQALYKQYFKGMGRKAFSSVQATAVWGLNFSNGLLTLSGFCDVWYDPDVKGKLILLSQPQFWVNLNTLKGMDGVNLSLGTEIEVSNNFVFNKNGDNDKFYVVPSLAAKWTF
ncbi:MAG: DUF5020 family protein [Bacteroidaceae bacterium]|nr:DUF5020 family protein [Bacteroidaceae bacterium]